MLEFIIDKTACINCKLCVNACVARIIGMTDGYPAIHAEKEQNCYKCQHCLTVCPTGAVSILGLKAEDSKPLAGNYPDPGQLETLIKGRRSIRSYKPENLDPALINKLLDVAWHAPTGKNSRLVHFTVIDDREILARLRSEVMTRLDSMAKDGRLPERMAYLGDLVKLWQKKKIDILFRDAPHLLIASTPADSPSPRENCLVALSYFELFAQSMGVGTVWDGFVYDVISILMPDLWSRLQIPDDHIVGYVMAFGKPAIKYARTAQHTPATIHRASF